MNAATIKIQTTPEVARFNRAVAWADELTRYHFDRLDVPDLVRVLRSGLFPSHHACADELQLAVRDMDWATRPNPNAGVVQPYPNGRY